MFLVPCCDVCYDFRHYVQMFVEGFMFNSCYLCLFVHSGILHILTTCVTRLMCNKMQELSSRTHGFTPGFLWSSCCSSFRLFSLICSVCVSSSCILCTQCCQCIWIVHSWLNLRISLTFMLD